MWSKRDFTWSSAYLLNPTCVKLFVESVCGLCFGVGCKAVLFSAISSKLGIALTVT